MLLCVCVRRHRIIHEHMYILHTGKIFHPSTASGAPTSPYPCEICQGEDDGNYSWSEPYFHAVSPVDNDYERSWVAVPQNATETSPLQDTQIADEAVRSIGEFAKEKDKPFFLAVGFHKPHLPFVFPEKYLELYPEDDIRVPENNYAPYVSLTHTHTYIYTHSNTTLVTTCQKLPGKTLARHEAIRILQL